MLRTEIPNEINMTIPLAIAIHAVPLCPLADKHREKEFRRQASDLGGWLDSPSRQDLRRYRIPKEHKKPYQ